MTSYRRPDDGVVTAAEMVEVKPGQCVARDVAIRLGLIGRAAPEPAPRPVDEIRAEAAPAARASEVVGGSEGDCSATSCGGPLPGADRVIKPPVDEDKPDQPHPRIKAGRQTGPQNRDGRRDGTPPEGASAPPAAPPPAKRARPAKRSLKEILADCRR